MCIQKKVGSILDLKIDGETAFLPKIKLLFETEYQEVVTAKVKNGIATIQLDRITKRDSTGDSHSIFSIKCNVDNLLFQDKKFEMRKGECCEPKNGSWTLLNGEKRFCCSTCGYAFTHDELNPFLEDIRIERMKNELELIRLQKKRLKLEISRKRLAIGSLRESLELKRDTNQ